MRGKEAHQARKRRLEADGATVTKKADRTVERGRPSSEMTRGGRRHTRQERGDLRQMGQPSQRRLTWQWRWAGQAQR